MKEKLWKRWKREYLNILTARLKEYAHIRDFKVVDLISVVDKQNPPFQCTLRKNSQAIVRKGQHY